MFKPDAEMPDTDMDMASSQAALQQLAQISSEAADLHPNSISNPNLNSGVSGGHPSLGLGGIDDHDHELSAANSLLQAFSDSGARPSSAFSASSNSTNSSSFSSSSVATTHMAPELVAALDKAGITSTSSTSASSPFEAPPPPSTGDPMIDGQPAVQQQPQPQQKKKPRVKKEPQDGGGASPASSSSSSSWSRLADKYARLANVPLPPARPRSAEPYQLIAFDRSSLARVFLDVDCELCSNGRPSPVFARRRFNVPAGCTYHNIYRLCIMAGWPLGEDDKYTVYSAVSTDHAGRELKSVSLGAPRSPTAKLGTWLRFLSLVPPTEARAVNAGYALPDAETWPGKKPLLCVASVPTDEFAEGDDYGQESWELRLYLRGVLEFAKPGSMKRLVPRCFEGEELPATAPGALPGLNLRPWNEAECDSLNSKILRTRFGANQSDNRRERKAPEDEEELALTLQAMRTNALPDLSPPSSAAAAAAIGGGGAATTDVPMTQA